MEPLFRERPEGWIIEKYKSPTCSYVSSKCWVVVWSASPLSSWRSTLHTWRCLLTTSLIWVILHSSTATHVLFIQISWYRKGKPIIGQKTGSTNLILGVERGLLMYWTLVVDLEAVVVMVLFSGKHSYWPLGTVCWKQSQPHWKSKPTHEPDLMILLHAMLWKQHCYC